MDRVPGNKQFLQKLIFSLLFLLSAALTVKAEPQPQKVFMFAIQDQIGPAAWRTVKTAIREAEAAQSDILLLHLNTYGGQVDMADSIRTALLNSKMKTVVFIDHNAASAGALIAIACDRIYMQQGGSIGAASVVNQTGEVMPEKYQSYMRSLMRATAEVKGRNAAIAEGFVDPELEIDSIKPKGKVLTFTTREAIRYGFCDGQAVNVQEVLKAEAPDGYTLTEKQLTLLDKLIGFLINPAVSGVLILLIIGGIYFELQSPGIGFALLVAVVAAVLYFAPLYLEGLAENWEIILFVVGVLLIILELFVIPGFGVIGIAGIICMVCGLAFSMVMNDYFNFTLSGTNALMNSFLVVILALIGAIVVSVMLGRNLLKSRLFQRMVLHDEQLSSDGYTIAQPVSSLKGEHGLAITDLRPSGKIEINGIRYDALSEDGFISKGDEVMVTRHETMSIFVMRRLVP
jgi:membrane-bound serine protease (ClpP class)